MSRTTHPTMPSPRARLLLALLLPAFLLGGCIRFDGWLPTIPGVYRATIQQGNVVTQEMVDRLKPGMTQRQVRFILGAPVIDNTFRDARWDYVYTVQVGSNERQQHVLTLWFDGDNLSYFEGDFLPTAVKQARERAEAEAAEAADA